MTTPDLATLDAEIRALAKAELDLSDDDLADDLASSLDSIQRLSLVVAIEDHYEICFDPDDEEGTMTLSDVVRLVHAKLNEPASDA